MARSTKAPTFSSRIEEALADGVLTETELMQRTGFDRDHVHTHLQTIAMLYRAARRDRVGDDWVWQLTPASDTRTRRCFERVPEGPGHRNGEAARKRTTRRFVSEANEIAERLRAQRSRHED